MPESSWDWLVLAAVWLACAAYLVAHLREGWIPYDAGALSYMAERVLRGQVPFRNFTEVYTGGLTYLNALSFRLFGARFFSLRIPLYLFFLGWVPSVYFLARRFVRPLAAGAVTLLAVAWSVPNYPEAMPSWYNLFFATWGVLALVRYIETERRRWLWIAGLCGGLSFLVKISGLYFVVAGLLFLIFREQAEGQARGHRPQATASETNTAGAEGQVTGDEGLGYRVFVTGGLVVFLAALTDLISQRPTISDYFQFVLPLGVLAGFLLWQTWTWRSAEGAVARFRRLFAMLAPFLGGMLVPMVLFAAWFAARGALRAWVVGVFVGPGLRTAWAAFDPSGPAGVLGLLPVGFVLLLASDRRRPGRRLARYLVPALVAGALVAAWKVRAVYILFAFTPPFLVPVVALAALFVFRPSGGPPEPRRQQAFAVVAGAVACALIQFPFSSEGYFEFVAPLVILALVALLTVSGRGRGLEPVATGSLLAFYFLFAVWLHTPGFYLGIQVPARRPYRLETFRLARAGNIRGVAGLVAEYKELVPVIRQHARGAYVYAIPDVPEVYFLTGLSDPTGDVYDILDPEFLYPLVRAQHTLAALEARGVNVVILGPTDTSLAGPIPPCFRGLLDARYPQSERVGDFEVRWRR